MKKIIITLFFLIGLNNIKAQSYIKMIDTTNVWDAFSGAITPNGDMRLTKILRFKGDTIINDTTYHNIFAMVYHTLNDSNLQYVGAIREDTLQQRIYKRNGYGSATIESVIFDFSLIPGDSLALSYDFYNRPNLIKLNSITSEFIASKLRRIFHITEFISNPFGWQSSPYQWIEGLGKVDNLGNLRGPIFNVNPGVADDPGIGKVLCFWQSGQMLYQDTNYMTCMIVSTTGINEIKQEKGIEKVYPNPTKDNLTIETNINTQQRIEILNLIGQTIYTSYINKKATINTSAFANGIYILKLSSDKETGVRKFVKQ